MTELLPLTWKVLRMRNFTPQTETQILKQFGTEPMIVIAVDWVQDGNVTFYTDRAITGQPVEGRILDISILDNVFNLEDNSDSKEISLTLDDSDEVLKDIINNNDIHGRPVSVFHWDASTPIADRALLFSGVINSPIIWDEGDRTLKLTVLSKLEDAEFGFSLDEALGIANQPLNLQGKAWPLCFGTVTNVPALRLTDVVEGKLESSVGIRDFTLVPKYNYLVNCSKCYTCLEGSNFDIDTLVSANTFRPCPNCNRRVCVAIRKLELQITAQTRLQFSEVRISGAARFPQGIVITLKIDEALFTGFFDGTTAEPSSKFIINRREHAKFSDIGATNATSVVNTINSEIDNLIDTNCGPTVDDRIDVTTICDGIPLDTDGLPQKQAKGVTDFWRVFNAWPTAGLQFIQPGARVVLATAADVAYVCNLVPSTNIIRVKANKRIGQSTRLVDVPDSFWSTRTVDFGSYDTTEIVFSKLLSEIDEEWEDDIFVTLESSEGPDIVEVIKFLINKYTNFTINTASFNSVQVDLTGWEANFALLERGNILTLLTDIAFQARCALYIKNNEIFIQFLAKRATPVDLILESDVENNSLSLGHTDTEDLVTKFVANWTDDYAAKEQVQTILRFNIGKYGLKEREFDFFIYNDEEMVKAAALFWTIRKSQIWRRLRFKTPINKLQLETFDNIEVRFNDFSPNDILAHIQQASYDSSDYSISFDCWTPVRSGEQSEFNFAFPEDVDITTVFPPIEDIESGSFDTSAPGALAVAPISVDPDNPVNPLSANTECDGLLITSKSRRTLLQGCWNVRMGRDREISDLVKPLGDTPTEEPSSCPVTSDLSDTSEDNSIDGGDVVDSDGNVIAQTVSTTANFVLVDFSGEVCPDQPNNESSDKEEQHGDPEDALGTEDLDNDPGIDGCNQPVCPDASPCGVIPENPPCKWQVNVTFGIIDKVLLGLIFKSTVTGTDEFFFNTFDAAQAFKTRMQARAIELNVPAVVGNQTIIGVIPLSQVGICEDDHDPDATPALIGFTQLDKNGKPIIGDCTNPTYLTD